MSRTMAHGRLKRLFVEAQRQEAALSRRELIALGAAGLALPALSGCGAPDGSDPAAERVAVIGAGLAGLHCALRLVAAGLDVRVYEASGRVGGRVYSAPANAGEGLIQELGGELIDSNHATLWALAEELGLDLDDRHNPDLLNDVWEVAGQRVSDATLLAQLVAVLPAFRAAYEAAETTDAGYAALDLTPMSDWLDENVPADSFPELHAVLLASYCGEFGLEPFEQSVLNLIYLFGFEDTDEFRIFGESDERWHTRGGNGAFAAALAARLEGHIELDARLEAVSGEDAQGFTLVLRRANGEQIDATATRVVFALPFTLLRQVDLDLPLSVEKRDLIDRLGYGTNAKLMGTFSRRVWEDTGSAGGATTDRPLQQVWDSSIGQDGDLGLLVNFLGGEAGLNSDQGSPEEAFAAGLPDIDALFPGAAAAYLAGSAARMHWPTHPLSLGSYTCYRPGEWATWGLEGRSEGRLHFCGEHCSQDFQGWMEGAAETGGLVAAEILTRLALPMDRAHSRAVAAARMLPQACFFGPALQEMRPGRRQAWRRRLSRA